MYYDRRFRMAHVWDVLATGTVQFSPTLSLEHQPNGAGLLMMENEGDLVAEIITNVLENELISSLSVPRQKVKYGIARPRPN